MTFSDAEDDQPTSLSNQANNPVNSLNNQSSSMDQSDINQATSMQQNSSNSEKESSNPSNTSSDSNTPLHSLPNGNILENGIENHSNTTADFSSRENISSQDINSDLNDASINGEESTENGAVATVPTSNSSLKKKEIESQKVMEKLQQIQGYIEQTSNTMQALENEGNMNKIGQYNTLMKVLKELKSSETKLISHLNILKEKIADKSFYNNIFDTFDVLIKSLQIQEKDYIDVLIKSLLTYKNEDNGESISGEESKETGSESIGVVGLITDRGSSNLSIHERLNYHQAEQEQLSARLRESIVRRQELMTRYQATRERLNNLKRQRLGIVQEERRVLQSAGAPETPYEDPIPGVESWSIHQLENAIKDFRILRDKIERVHEAYQCKQQMTSDDDTETQNNLQRKMEQIQVKKTHIDSALTKMNDLLHAKRQEHIDTNTIHNQRPVCDNENSNNRESDDTCINETPSNTVENTIHCNKDSESNQKCVKLPCEDSNSYTEGTSDGSEAAHAMETQELIAKKQYLQSLKNQLSAMKQLLQITQDNADTHMENTDNLPDNDKTSASVSFDTESSQNDGVINVTGGVIDETVVGVNGTVIQLSELERRNPIVIAKFQQLSMAKERLAKMEDVMRLITEASHEGKPLDQVLSDEYMAILTDAKEEIGSIDTQHLRRNSDSILDLCGQPVNNRASQQNSASSVSNKRDCVNEMAGQSDWQREREISAMQLHLIKKKTAGISAVNDGSKVTGEKGAIKKQATDLFSKDCDPRVSEVLVLQEELREKKNALEALMNRMGKSTSFTLDNISDNISENISDTNSDLGDRPSAASWGAAQSRYLSDPLQSEEDILRNRKGSFGAQFNHYEESLFPSHQKNRNRFNSANIPRNSENCQFSVNNLSGSNPQSVRPKHNRYHGGSSVPVSALEDVRGNSAPTTNSDPNNKVQNTVSAAFSQLSQVQETINSLYEELRNAERLSRQQSVYYPYGNNEGLQRPHVSAAVPNIPANHQPPPGTQGATESGMTNQLVSGLQQCFSQLYLHSLEIQSLNKYLQIIDQQRETQSSSMPPNELSPQMVQRNNQLSQPSRARDEADGNEFSSSGHSLPNFQYFNKERRKDLQKRHRRNDNSENVRNTRLTNSRINEETRTIGPVNSSYERLSNSEPLIRSSQRQYFDSESHLTNKNFLSNFDEETLNDIRHHNNDILFERIPIEAENNPWTVDSSNVQQSSDILNNQVLPGTRANNYWDNFRSYSRQNPLSNVTKFNPNSGQTAQSGSSHPAHMGNERVRQSMSFENRQYNIMSGSNNSINKASDKNSSTSRRQNAQSKYPLQPSNYDRATQSDSFVFNSAFPERTYNTDDRKNSGINYAGSMEWNSLNRHETVPSSYQVAQEIENQDTTLRDSHSKRYEAIENIQDGIQNNSLGRHLRRQLNSQRQLSNSNENLRTSEAAYIQAVNEAESLMQKQSKNPQFLLQLFRHAARITSLTDQHVALELLKEISSQGYEPNIEFNRCNSSSSFTQSDNFSFGASGQRRGSRDNYRNKVNKDSHVIRGISGSDASESGMSSDEDVRIPLRKEPFQVVKNRPNSTGNTLNSHNQSTTFGGKLPSTISPVLTNIHSEHKSLPKSFTAQNHLEAIQRIQGAGKNSSRNLMPNFFEESINESGGSLHNAKESVNESGGTLQNAKSYEQIFQRNEEETRSVEGDFSCTRKKKSHRNFLTQASKSNFNSSKNPHKNFNVASNESVNHSNSHQSIAGFESLVSAALKEVLQSYEWAENNNSSSSFLQTLHKSIMRQVEQQSKNLGLPLDFVLSVDAHLKSTFQRFFGKRISEVRQELAPMVTQVLIHEYYSALFQRGNSSDYIQPPTPDVANCPYDPFQINVSNAEAAPVSQATVTQPFNNQHSINNTFTNASEGASKQLKPNLFFWSSQNFASSEDNWDDKSSSQKNDERSSPARSRGIINKVSLASLNNTNNDFINSTTRGGSPTIEAQYPEAWLGARGGVCMEDTQEGQFGSHRARHERGSKERLELEHNDAEADQATRTRNIKDFCTSSLPVHDLAEADQSQDVIEVQLVDSTLDDDSIADRGAYNQLGHQNQDSPIRLINNSNLGPNMGLDEVPTRLLSGPDGASPPLPGGGNITGRHPPEGVASSGGCRPRTSNHVTVTPPHFSPSNSSHQSEGRHPPDGGTQPSQSNFQLQDPSGNGDQ